LLVAINSGGDYTAGRLLGNIVGARTRKLILFASIFLNLAILGFFKYFDFFAGSLNILLASVGISFQVHTLNLFLPLAISYYTLQTMSYTIDVSRGKIKPVEDFVAFFAYITFFPKLLSGPIERATTCLPQFLKKREFDYDKAADGLRQILWGLFKKMVVADSCAVPVNAIFAEQGYSNGSTLLLGGVLFAVQIYADFSGYSDIAIGTARLFGIDLMRNFANPYFSKNIAEFWQRWHISLSTWLRDYLFLPMSYSLARKFNRESYLGIRVDRIIGIIATNFTFLICGLWHGANLTYVVWGMMHGLMLTPQIFKKKKLKLKTRLNRYSWWHPAFDFIKISTTFLLVVLAWIIFRAENISAAISYLREIFTWTLFDTPSLLLIKKKVPLGITILVIVEWLQRNRQHGMDFSGGNIPQPVRWTAYVLLTVATIIFSGSPQKFIYFKF